MSRTPKLALPGRTVLVTGAGSGIGAASAKALADAGANVALVDLQPTGLADVATALGPRGLALPADVTDTDAIADAAAKTVEHFGSLDVVFADAGIAGATPHTIRSVREEEFEKIVEVDLFGVWRTVRACLQAVSAANGHVLATSSVTPTGTAWSTRPTRCPRPRWRASAARCAPRWPAPGRRPACCTRAG